MGSIPFDTQTATKRRSGRNSPATVDLPDPVPPTVTTCWPCFHWIAGLRRSQGTKGYWRSSSGMARFRSLLCRSLLNLVEPVELIFHQPSQVLFTILQLLLNLKHGHGHVHHELRDAPALGDDAMVSEHRQQHHNNGQDETHHGTAGRHGQKLAPSAVITHKDSPEVVTHLRERDHATERVVLIDSRQHENAFEHQRFKRGNRFISFRLSLGRPRSTRPGRRRYRLERTTFLVILPTTNLSRFLFHNLITDRTNTCACLRPIRLGFYRCEDFRIDRLCGCEIIPTIRV